MLALQRRLRIEPRQLRLELGDVAELAVHRGEAHVRDRVQRPQPAQGQLADLVGARLAAPRAHLGDDPVDHRLQLLALDRPLDRGPLEARQQLGAVERLAAAAALADVDRPLVVALVGGEAAVAGAAAPAAPNGVAGLAQTGVDDLRFAVVTEWAAHVLILLDVGPFSSTNRYMLRFFPNLGVYGTQARRMGCSGASSALGPRVHAASPHLGQREVVAAAPVRRSLRARWPTDEQTAGGREAARDPTTRSCRRSAGAFSGARTCPPGCGGWSDWRRRRSAASPRTSPPRVTRGKPASSIVPWPGTSSSPVAGSAASTRPASSSARCRARARASRSSTTSTSCSTRPFLPEAAAGMLEPRHVVTPLRDVLEADASAPGRRGRARRGPAHGDAAATRRAPSTSCATTGSSSPTARFRGCCRSPGWPSMRSGSRASPTRSGCATT